MIYLSHYTNLFAISWSGWSVAPLASSRASLSSGLVFFLKLSQYASTFSSAGWRFSISLCDAWQEVWGHGIQKRFNWSVFYGCSVPPGASSCAEHKYLFVPFKYVFFPSWLWVNNELWLVGWPVMIVIDFTRRWSSYILQSLNRLNWKLKQYNLNSYGTLPTKLRLRIKWFWKSWKI